MLVDVGNGLFLPQIGDEFKILSAVGGVIGQFLNNPVSHAGGQQFHWSVLCHPFDVTLQLTSVTMPEPASALLVFAGAMALPARRRMRGVAV